MFKLLVKPIIRFFADYELKKDKEILENLADKQMPLSEMQLGRYDRVLGENRKRYRSHIPEKIKLLSKIFD